MHEPEFFNYSSFQAELLPLIERDGSACRTAVVKATYALPAGRQPHLADVQRPIRLGDEMWGQPNVPDIKYPGDACTFKPGTDVLIVGHAVAGEGAARDYVDVNLRFAARTKRLRAYGERVWVQSAGGVVVSRPDPVRRVPLAWSRAFGGFDGSGPGAPVEESRNPVGRGVAGDPRALLGQPGPQVENPDEPIVGAPAHYGPVGCAAIGRHFEPRRRYAGTHDASWLRNRHPAVPVDYQDAYQNAAPPDQVFQEPLRGGEPIGIYGMSLVGPIEFQLPLVRIVVEAEIDGSTRTARPHLDTVLIDADARLVELVWRAAFRCPPKMRGRFTLVRVIDKEVQA